MRSYKEHKINWEISSRIYHEPEVNIGLRILSYRSKIASYILDLFLLQEKCGRKYGILRRKVPCIVTKILETVSKSTTKYKFIEVKLIEILSSNSKYIKLYLKKKYFRIFPFLF